MAFFTPGQKIKRGQYEIIEVLGQGGFGVTYLAQDYKRKKQVGNYSYADAPKGKYRKQTTDVGSFPPNAFGLYDMHGNIWEWCEDDCQENYINAPSDDSALISESEYKLLRGGSWCLLPVYCRSVRCFYAEADFYDSNFGFRVVCGAAWSN